MPSDFSKGAHGILTQLTIGLPAKNAHRQVKGINQKQTRVGSYSQSYISDFHSGKASPLPHALKHGTPSSAFTAYLASAILH